MSVLEVVIQGVDKLSGPAKSAQGPVIGLSSAVRGMNGFLDQNGRLHDSVTGKFKALGDAMVQPKTNAAALGDQLALLTGGMSYAVEAIGAVAASLGALVIAGASLAIEASEAKTKMLALFDAMGEGKISGQQMDEMLDGMRERLGITKDAMVPYAEAALRMGITTQGAVESMTQAAISAKALAGGSEAGAQAFLKLAEKAKLAADTGQALKIPARALSTQFAEMGLNIDDVANAMGVSSKVLAAGLKSGTVDARKFGDAMQDALIKKGKGPLEQMSLSVGNLGSLLKEYIGDLFEDLGPSIKPFLEQVKQLFGIFDSKANPSGQALKQGIEGFFKRVFAVATKLVPMVKHFLLDIIIYALKAYIAAKPLVQTFERWYTQIRSNEKYMKALHQVMVGLKIVFTSLAVGLAVVLGVFMAIQAAVVLGIAQFAALAAFITGFVATTIVTLEGWAKSAYDMAKDFVNGLIKGITDGAAAVGNAVKNLATQAKDSFKKTLGISSPSKVMMELGGHVASGAAKGVEAGAPQVNAASASLGQSMAVGAAAGASGAGGGGGAGVTVNVEPGAIVITGSGKESATELTETAIVQLFERVALAQGLG